MILISWKVELKLKRTNHCALSAPRADNDDVNQYNIIFTIEETNLYFRAVTLSTIKRH